MHIRVMSAEHCGDIQAVLCCLFGINEQQDCIASKCCRNTVFDLSWIRVGSVAAFDRVWMRMLSVYIFVPLCTSFSIGASLVADCTLITVVGIDDLEEANQMNMMRIRVMNAEHCGDIQAVLCCFISN